MNAHHVITNSTYERVTFVIRKLWVRLLDKAKAFVQIKPPRLTHYLSPQIQVLYPKPAVLKTFGSLLRVIGRVRL
jgi:hypothetical protein